MLRELGVLRQRVSELEKQLAEQETAKLAKLSAENPNPVLRISNDCTILYANDASSIVLQTWQRRVGERLPEPCCQRAKESISRGEVSTFEFTCVDGRMFLVTLAPVAQEGYLNAYGVDVTERKQKEDKLTQYQFMVESANDAIFYKDLSSRYIVANQKTLEAFGLTAEQVVGKNDYEIMPDAEEAKKNIEDDRLVFNTGKAAEVTKKMTDASGNQRWFHGIKVPQFDDKGRITGLVGIARDITDRTNAEAALAESEAKYRDLVEEMTDVIYTLDRQGIVTWVNKANKATFGREPEEVIGRSFTEWIPQGHLADAMAVFERILGGEKATAETVLLDRQGMPHNVEYSSTPVVKDGVVVGTRGIIRDITQRKRAEQELKQSEATLRSLIDSATESVLLMAPDGTVLAANIVVAERLGTTVDGLIGKCGYDFLPPDLAESRKLQVEKVVRTGQPVIFEDVHGARHILHSLNPIKDSAGRVTRVAVFALDMTERKKMEDELRESRNLLRRIIDMLPVRVFWKNKDSQYLGCNEAFAKDAGLEAVDEIVGKNDFELVWKNQAQLFRAGDKEVIETGRPKLAYEEQSTTPSGNAIWLNTSKVPLKNTEGQSIGVLGVYSDVTAQKQMQEALRQSEAKYRTLVENLPQKIFLKDKNSVYISCNENYARDLKIKPEDIAGKTDYDFYPKELAEKYRADDREIVESGRTTEIEEKYILPGKEFIVYTVKTPVRDERGDVAAILGIFWDVTESKRKERELNLYREKMDQAERLASLGTLSATIAHELTQPLTTIRLSIENSLVDLERTSSPPDAIEGLKDSLDEISNVVSIVDRLRSFARESSEKTISEVELKVVAERVAHLLRRNAQQANISLRLKGMDRLPPIYAHEKDMEQLFFALVENAIRAANGRKSRWLTISGAVKEQCIELRFADNCGGIAPENLNKVFEPFFTTKPAGEGTGLGLCVVHRVVSRAGGKVWVESRPGKGATFFVTLPIGRMGES